ncbi:MAG: hypothetical protein K9J16_01940 [Melioribacteraceae bacterium]|nr:hypothetical protein [Melioribacteraceae bacterium]MCF8353027.1 hypothetical protein [Melioribacteraceae bacterium]MCF8392918.1 hypothetical protein [Melioribacteraceae bacterium]MCF8417788.1 hypothetical protein [Melioribacteraceae bacterium]
MELSKYQKKWIFWSPRILAIIFAIFISIFAFDVFTENYSTIWESILALALHLFPTFIVLMVLIISWNFEWIGGIIYTAMGIYYIFITSGDMNWSAYIIIPGTLFLIAVLFFINWYLHDEIRKPDRFY